MAKGWHSPIDIASKNLGGNSSCRLHIWIAREFWTRTAFTIAAVAGRAVIVEEILALFHKSNEERGVIVLCNNNRCGDGNGRLSKRQ